MWRTNIQEEVLSEAVVPVAAVEPDACAAVAITENIAAEQSVLALMEFQCTGLPRFLHMLPASALDQIILNEHILDSGARDAADAAIIQLAATDDGVADDLIW